MKSLIQLSHCRLACAAAMLFGLTGCASGLLNLSSPSEFTSRLGTMITGERAKLIDKEEDNDFDSKVETPLLGEYVSVGGNNLIALRGVGLVTGLDGTGGDPPPSHLRQALMDEMKKLKVPGPGQVLASRNTALVMVTAYLPAMVKEGQRFDVRVTLPPNSQATSLKGGTLLETRLAEERVIAGRGNIRGHNYAIAHGAILTAMGTEAAQTSDFKAMQRRGSIPGGAVSRTERHLEVNLRGDKRSLKTAKQVETAISKRLHHYDRFGQRIAMAEAKTDLLLELRVHPMYRNNFPRYQKVIRSIALRETEVARRLRLEQLAEELLDPATAERASLQLEAIGAESIPFLIDALAHENLEVNFHAAQALAYMEDSSGVDVLKRAVVEEPAFRVYGLAALSVIKDANAIVALRELLSSEELEVRYGAVRALKECHPTDAHLGTRKFGNKFVLHAIETDGPPAAHIVRYREPEIVLFGSQQQLRMPTVLNCGNRLRVIGRAGDKTVEITKYKLGSDPVRQRCTTNLADVVKCVADLGATYPDVAQMLLEAERQNSLIGELGIDRLPQAGRMFKRASGGASRSTRLGAPAHTPGLFDRIDESDREEPEVEPTALERMLTAEAEAEAKTEAPEDASNDAEGKVRLADASAEATPFTEQAEPNFSTEMAEPAEPTMTNEGEMEVEKHNFKPPIGSRVKSFFKNPFAGE